LEVVGLSTLGRSVMEVVLLDRVGDAFAKPARIGRWSDWPPPPSGRILEA